jgi:hypothetical protein
MNETMSAGEAMALSIQSIPADLAPPYVDSLVEAAGRVSSAQQAVVISALLGNAESYGANVPTSLHLPADHRMHLDMGREWYWLSANLTVDGTGGRDQIGVIIVIARSRAVTNAVQAQAGWSDTEAQIVDSTATVTLSTEQVSKIVRRRPNVQWTKLGGQVEFQPDAEHPGEAFLYRCGPDSLRGSRDVVPLEAVIDDGENMKVKLTLSTSRPAGADYFLQGDNGLTPAPKAGLYYSWPQLAVSGTVEVEGRSYAVSGTGWIDHQMMMYEPASVPAPPPPLPPAPSAGWVPTQQVNGWSWCQFNLENGDVFTGAAFLFGAIGTDAAFTYGFYLKPCPQGWEKIFIQGHLHLDRFLPGLHGVPVPTAWRYEVSDVVGGGLADIVLVPGPIYPDGTFTTGNMKVQAETPVAVSLVNRAGNNSRTGPSTVLTGTGYCESVDYGAPEEYLERAFRFLGIG